MPEGDTTFLGDLLRRAGQGERDAADALLRHTGERLSFLARRMLGRFPRVKRWAQTDDVLQNALLRLLSALKDVKPRSTRDFLALANLQIRRELLDLARRFHGPLGVGANHDTGHGENPQALEAHRDNDDPASLMQWSELHQQIGALPDDEREAVELLFYQGLPQADAARMLDVSVRTLQRRCHAALLKLHHAWNAAGPAPP